MKIRFYCLLLFSVFIATQFAAKAQVKGIGKVTAAIISGQQVSITTENANAQITVYSPSIIRVRIDKQQLATDFSYAVIAKPQTTKATITQNDQEISIVTDSLKVRINKNPFLVTF